MNIRLALATATAMGLLMGAAYSGSGNEAYTAQDGDTNVMKIQQSAGTGGNRVGTELKPVLQDGNNNTFQELQNTGGGTLNMKNNVINAALQKGNFNSFSSSYSQNNSGNNIIGNVLQQGNSNSASVTRNGGYNGTVSDLRQIGSSNFLSIDQAGSGNVVTSAVQDGSNNGNSAVNRWNKGTNISQNGSDNEIQEASITGSNNIAAHPLAISPAIPNPGGYASIDITQKGTGNGSVMAIARMTGSNGNQIVINQDGDYNQFSVIQGTTTADTRNSATLVQKGNSNEALIEQRGSFNSARMTFEGDSNGLVSLSGVAGTLVSTSGGLLVAGKALQDSSTTISGNSLTYEVVGNLNKFAFAQIGGGNTINGAVNSLGASSGNQVAVIQKGSSNTSTFTQNGGSNNLAVSQ